MRILTAVVQAGLVGATVYIFFRLLLSLTEKDQD